MEQLPALLDGTVTLCAQLGSSDASKAFAAKQLSTAMALVGAAVNLSMEVAAQLVGKVQKMDCWSSEQKEELLKQISSKAVSQVGLASAGETLHVSGRRAMQDYCQLMHYVVPSVWEILQDASRTSSAKIDVLSDFATKLGLRCPSEPTYSAMMAIVEMVTGVPERSSEEAHQVFKGIKQRIKACCDNAPAHNKPYVAALPVDPNLFVAGAWGREVFATESPGQVPFPVHLFVAHWKRIPLRITNVRASPFCTHRAQTSQSFDALGDDEPGSYTPPATQWRPAISSNL